LHVPLLIDPRVFRDGVPKIRCCPPPCIVVCIKVCKPVDNKSVVEFSRCLTTPLLTTPVRIPKTPCGPAQISDYTVLIEGTFSYAAPVPYPPIVWPSSARIPMNCSPKGDKLWFNPIGAPNPITIICLL